MERRSFITKSLLAGGLAVLPSVILSGKTLKKKGGNKKSRYSANQVMDEFQQRRMFLLENTAGRDTTAAMILDPAKDLFSNRAIANLMLNRYPREANQRIRHTAQWFDHPHPDGRKQEWEPDFAALKLCRAAYLFRNTTKLEKETLESIASFFLNQDFKSVYESENHGFMFRVSRYGMAQMYPDRLFKAYSKKGADLLLEDAKWIKEFIRYRARQGWGEFDSSCYYTEEWEILLTLHDCTEDKEIKQLTKMMLNLILADASVDSLNGMYCGAQGRIYMPHALDHANEPMFVYQYLYFGMIPQDQIGTKSLGVDALVSSFIPEKLVIDLALNRLDTYENFERKHLHNMSDIKPEHPINGSIRKYTYYTPKCVMGCVQLQDPYPDGTAKGYAFHEQHDWDLSFAASTRSRIFTHHPGTRGNEHNYWTGDIQCGCGHFFQNKTALLCLYDISAKEPYQFIHAWLPKAEFDEVVESKGIIFVRSGDNYAALKMLGGHEWTTTGEWKDKEVISKGAKNGAVCEIGHLDDFGSFTKFQQEILGNAISFDTQKMELSYASKRAGKLTLNTKDLRKINDQPADLNYPLFKSPYLRSEWDSGIITVTKNGEKLELDFRG